MQFEHIAFVGLGLIGGSIAAGFRQRDAAVRFSAFDINTANLKRAMDEGLIDDIASSAKAAVVDADLVVIATPVVAMAEVMEEIKSVFSSAEVVVTDVGSVKAEVCDFVADLLGQPATNFVPGHPIAGSEQAGVGAANGDLFAGRKTILTPLAETESEAIAKVTALWETLDATVVTMTPAHHDEILAQTSHLPHLLAYALVDTLSSGGDSLEIFQYAAGGFRDFSRIAASDPVMWRDVFRTNSGPVLAALSQFRDRLDEMEALIRDGRVDDLAKIFARAKAARDHFSSLIEGDDD